MASRDFEVRRVAAELDVLIAELRVNVDALQAILVPPDAPDADGKKEQVPA